MGRGRRRGGQRTHLGLSPHISGSWPADLMTEMTDLSSDLEASGIPFLDYHTYAERVFFPGHGSCPLQPTLEGPGEEARRVPVRQGLTQLSNLLNSKLFLTKVPSALPGPRPQASGLSTTGGRGGRLLAPPLGPWPCLLCPSGSESSAPSPSCLPAPVHPHPGEPAHLLGSGPGLRGISAHRGAAWEARVLH